MQPQPGAPTRVRANPACLALGLALVGCASPFARPATPGPMRITLDRHLGTPISGPRAAEAERANADPEQDQASWIASVRFGLLAGSPPAQLPPLASEANLVTDSGLAQPIRGVPQGLAAARLGSTMGDTEVDPAATDGILADVVWLGSLEGALLPSTTSTLTLSCAESGLVLAGIEYSVAEGQPPTWALFAPNASAAEDRLHFADAPTDEDHPALIFAPMPQGSTFGTVVIETLLHTPQSGSVTVDHGALGTTQVSVRQRSELELGSLVGLLGGESTRSALALLTETVDAPATADLALIGDDELLGAIGTAAREEATGPMNGGAIEAGTVGSGPLDGERLALALERATLSALASAQSAEGLDDSLEALLLRHAGEMGHLPSALTEVLRASTTIAGLRERLVSENRLLLEDPDPAARMRAMRWLSLRGRAPEGFEPLADRDARRAALAQDLERRTAGEQP
ncbi:hypothetical protein [Engelhardtia mirabilis]